MKKENDPMDAPAYGIALVQCEEDLTAEEVAAQICFVFCSPWQIFLVWLESLRFKYFRF